MSATIRDRRGPVTTDDDDVCRRREPVRYSRNDGRAHYGRYRHHDGGSGNCRGPAFDGRACNGRRCS